MRDLRQAIALRTAIAVAALTRGRAARRLPQPYFVVTAGRSGSTFLMRVLDQLPGLVVYPGEANRLWHPNAYPWRRFREAVPRFWQEPERFVEHTLSHRTAVDDRRLRATFSTYRALMGGGVFVCKSAMIHFMLPWVCRLFPEARFIHLVRDGRAVALSYGKRLLARGKGGAGAGPDDEMLLTLARFWRDSVAAVAEADDELGLQAGGRLLEVTYESLCADPAGELKRLESYLGITRAPAVGTLPASFDNRNWKFERELPSGLAAAMTALMRPGLERYGYA